MKRIKGLVLKAALGGAALCLLGGGVFLGFLNLEPPGAVAPAKPAQAEGVAIFAAPSEVAPGESWVFLASVDDLPADLEAAPRAAGVAVLETRKLSPKAISVRVSLAAVVPGELLTLLSPSQALEWVPAVHAGAAVPALTAAANFGPGDFFDGYLAVNRRHFIYAYTESSPVSLAALRIHNRALGRWFAHEITIEKAQRAAEPPPEGSLHFRAVSELETLPDTDGDGIYDFDEEPEVEPPLVRQLGIELAPGPNTLDVVALDEAGNASWETIGVWGN